MGLSFTKVESGKGRVAQDILRMRQLSERDRHPLRPLRRRYGGSLEKFKSVFLSTCQVPVQDLLHPGAKLGPLPAQRLIGRQPYLEESGPPLLQGGKLKIYRQLTNLGVQRHPPTLTQIIVGP